MAFGISYENGDKMYTWLFIAAIAYGLSAFGLMESINQLYGDIPILNTVIWRFRRSGDMTLGGLLIFIIIFPVYFTVQKLRNKPLRLKANDQYTLNGEGMIITLFSLAVIFTSLIIAYYLL